MFEPCFVLLLSLGADRTRFAMTDAGARCWRPLMSLALSTVLAQFPFFSFKTCGLTMDGTAMLTSLHSGLAVCRHRCCKEKASAAAAGPQNLGSGTL